MQEYSNFEDTEYISDAPTKLNKNMQSIITDFSGASFPTANLFVGMKCLRTDENKVYRLYETESNQLVWQLEYTIVDGGIKVEQATNDANNKAITSYVADVEVGSTQGTIKVTNGAGESTEFTSYTIATQNEAEVGTDNTKGMTPLRTKQLGDKHYLPLSGGQLTGFRIYRNVDNSSLQLESGTAIANGAYLTLFGGDYNTDGAGAWQLVAVNKATGVKKSLIGYPDGKLLFDGKQLATTDDFAPSVSQRNGYCRRKNLGTIASVADADAFNTAHGLSAGTFDDIFVGDEITIKDGTYNAVWLVAGVDWDYNKGDTASGHGILLIPKAPLYNDQMNSTNVTTGGYKGSAMHTTKLPALVTKLQTVLGSHLKKRRVLISNSVNTSLASMAGEGWTGASNGWEWVDTYAVLPSEVEVYGSTVFSSSFRDVGEACQKLPIFNFINPVYFSRWDFWLRAVAGSTAFCRVGSDGGAGSSGASNSGGVRPLIYLA